MGDRRDLRRILRHAFDVQQDAALPERPERSVASPFTLAPETQDLYCIRCRRPLPDEAASGECPACGQPFDRADASTCLRDPAPRWLCRLCVTLGTWTLVALLAGFLLTFIVAPVVHLPLTESPVFPLGQVVLGAGVLGGVTLFGLVLLGRMLARGGD